MNFTQSEALLQRALKVIPGGTQTFSKSRTTWPEGVTPAFIQRGKGSHVWDVDGNEYIDFTSALCPIILGYCDEDVDNAVKNQISEGTIFGLPHPLEVEVAEAICEMVPCAEMVRFGKNGSDATSGAMRLARAYTGRDHIAQCGYHGWQDWSVAPSARNFGVPSIVKSLTHPFTYNDIDSLNQIFKMYPENVACVIMEPMNREWPAMGFLEDCKEIAHKNHALFIFDEMITGFRFAIGGAQEYFNVIPDLACFGKAMGNGYPISAVVGKGEYMRWFEKIHFSFTYGGDCVGLAAAKETLRKIKNKNVDVEIFAIGGTLFFTMENIGKYLSGHPAWTFFNYNTGKLYGRNYIESAVKTIFIQELVKRGILCIGQHVINASHSANDMATLIEAYTEIIENFKDMNLECEPLKGEFRIR
jgi:glutamate-1-semialdehyde 2,1-aminomutase